MTVESKPLNTIILMLHLGIVDFKIEVDAKGRTRCKYDDCIMLGQTPKQELTEYLNHEMKDGEYV